MLVWQEIVYLFLAATKLYITETLFFCWNGMYYQMETLLGVGGRMMETYTTEVDLSRSRQDVTKKWDPSDILNT